MTRLAMVFLVVVFAARLAAVQLPGTQFSPARPPEEMQGVGAIDVIVIADESGRPVAGATVRVFVLTDNATFTKASHTDLHGRARVFGLAKGRVRVSASHPRYVVSILGQSSPDDMTGTHLELDEQQQLKPITLRLTRGATLAGSLLDEMGEPLAGVQVRAFRRSADDGRWAFHYATSDETDDRGDYRITNLQAGDYVVGMVPFYMERGEWPDVSSDALTPAGSVPVSPAPEPTLALGNGRVLVLHPFSPLPVVRPSAGRAFGYEPTYFPGGPLSSATVISVGPGQVREGLDLRLRATPVSRVAGYVVHPEPSVLGPVNLFLVPIVPEARDVAYERHISFVGERGEFNFPFVPDGDYWLTGRLVRSDGPHMWIRTPLTVGTTALDDLRVSFRDGMSFSGALRFADAQVEATVKTLEGHWVSLAPAAADSPEPTGMRTTRTQGDGSFQIASLPPGVFTLQSTTLPQEIGLLSALANGIDLLDAGVRIEPGASFENIVVTVGRMGSISGVVRDASGQPSARGHVVLFSTEERYWTPESRRVKASRPATTGRYVFSGLPPGEYQLAAIASEPQAWRDPAFLKTLRARAVTVVLRAGEQSRDLQIK